MSFKLLSFSNDTELAKGAAANWLALLRARKNPVDTRYTVALSGGRIARTLFSEIVRGAGLEGIGLFQNVHFFWADERCVPPTDPESNYAAARDLLFEPLKISEAQIHRLRGEGPEALALSNATDEILRISQIANGVPALDMIFLGMGEDGHVASLFPGESEDAVKSAAIYRAVTAVKPPPRRMTVGYGVIAAAREVWVVAAGAGKEGALRESISPNGRTPLAQVLSQRAETIIFTDIQVR